jgi:hypothetical protein
MIFFRDQYSAFIGFKFKSSKKVFFIPISKHMPMSITSYYGIESMKDRYQLIF